MFKLIQILFLLSLLGCSVSSFNQSKENLHDTIDSLSAYEKQALTLFFRTLLVNTYSGYSLYGKKPLSGEGLVLRKISFSANEELAKKGAILKEGCRIWKKSGLSNIQSPYAICASGKFVWYGWSDFTFINKKSFLKVVDLNLPLFQYILGPKVTSTLLLDQLLSNEGFFSVFHENRVLNGIVLGFGTQNSLHGSRAEYLQEYLEGPPEEIPSNPTSIPSLEERASAILSHYPSFGFSTIDQEFNTLIKEQVVTASHEDPLPTLPWFGSFSPLESDPLLKNYKRTQKQILSVLNSSNFLSQVLSKFFDTKISLSNKKVPLAVLLTEKLKAEKNLSLYLGRAFGENFKKNSAEPYKIDLFIQGMTFSESETVCTAPQEEAELHLFQLGKRTWDRFKNLKTLISLDAVAEGIRDAQQNEIALNENEWEVVDQLDLLSWIEA